MEGIRFFHPTPRLIIGPGSINQLPEEIGRLNGKRVVLVTDPGLVQSGIVFRVEEALIKVGLSVHRFDDVEPDPRYETAVYAAERAKEVKGDLVIGIGGGSALDIAKVSSILVTNSEPVNAYFGIDLVPNRGLPLLLVPTTAGTGSEVTPIAILSDHHEKLKKGIVSPYLIPATAVLDAELTVGLPPSVTAATGMDALIHAVEAYTSKNANRFTDLLAIEAMTMLFRNIRAAFAKGTDIEARAMMLEGSLLAGKAFANAGVTAVHAFAYPIGAEFHIPHGVANSMMLAPVMKFNMVGNLPKFARMARVFDDEKDALSEEQAAKYAVEALKNLASDLNIPSRLSDFGIKEQDIPMLAEGVMKVTRLLANNPRELALDDAIEIYRQVL